MTMNDFDLTLRDAYHHADLQQQRDILRARRYYAGEHGVTLPPRLQQFIGPGFRLNASRTVISALVERLHLRGFGDQQPEQATARAHPRVAAWAGAVWQHNRMDARQDAVHTAALRDGETFVIVDWDVEHDQPRFSPHPRFTALEAGGDGFGVYLVHPDDDPARPPLAAVKQWAEQVDGQQRLRRTVYYPDRVARYAHDGRGWQPYRPDDGPWPLPWLDLHGQPLGIPVVAFRNPDRRPEAWDALPLQDALNKTLIDLLSTADHSAFQVLVALGWVPTTDARPPAADGSNRLTIDPGQIIGTTRPKTEADLKALPPADLGPLLDLAQQLLLWLALVSDTPITRFITTRQVASEQTLRQQEEPLLIKVRSRQTRYGNAWEDAMQLARRLANTFGAAALPPDTPIEALWAPASRRPDPQQLTEWRTKAALGVPQAQLWREMGYPAATVAGWGAERPEALEYRGTARTAVGGERPGRSDHAETIGVTSFMG